MLRLGVCSDVVASVVIVGTGAELEGPTSGAWPVGGSVEVVTRGTTSIAVDVYAG